jgi:hypothetical protein
VVGRIGKNTPAAPNPKEIVPATTNIPFLKLLGLRMLPDWFITMIQLLDLFNLAITRLHGIQRS